MVSFIEHICFYLFSFCVSTTLAAQEICWDSVCKCKEVDVGLFASPERMNKQTGISVCADIVEQLSEIDTITQYNENIIGLFRITRERWKKRWQDNAEVALIGRVYISANYDSYVFSYEERPRLRARSVFYIIANVIEKTIVDAVIISSTLPPDMDVIAERTSKNSFSQMSYPYVDFDVVNEVENRKDIIATNSPKNRSIIIFNDDGSITIR